MLEHFFLVAWQYVLHWMLLVLTLDLTVTDGLAKLHSNNANALEKVLDIDKDSGLADGCGSDDLPLAKIVGKADVYGGESSEGELVGCDSAAVEHCLAH